MIKQFRDEPVTTFETDGERPCACGFSAEKCAPNPCLRKMEHIAGITPGSVWPEGAPLNAAARTKDSDLYVLCLELLHTTDVMLSMLLAVIPDADMRRQVDELLKRIEVMTRNCISLPDHEAPMIEFGSCWAKVHYKRNVTELDRARLASALR